MEFTIHQYKPTKTGYGEGLLAAGMANAKLYVLGADITSSTGVNIFAEALPERFLSFGIAEQNIAAVSAGMALSGLIPSFCTYAVFSAFRCVDQIRVSICYNQLHVIIGGAHAGISVGPDGATHQALEDISVMRSLPEMTVLSPCDATQSKLAVLAAVNQINSPVYIRFGRESVPDFTLPDFPFVIGKGQVFCEGNDCTIFATGHMVWESILAHRILQEQGISVKVVNIHTIKPIDSELIIASVRETGAAVTVEEHQINGGFGSAVSEVIVQHYPVPVEMIGIHNQFGESGQPQELMKKYGLTAENIVVAVKRVLDRKK